MQIDTRPRGPRAKQPIEVASNPSAWLNIETIRAITGMCKTKIYAELKAGKFVQPIRRGARCTRWRAGEVMAWMDAQANEAAQ